MLWEDTSIIKYKKFSKRPWLHDTALSEPTATWYQQMLSLSTQPLQETITLQDEYASSLFRGPMNPQTLFRGPMNPHIGVKLQRILGLMHLGLVIRRPRNERFSARKDVLMHLGLVTRTRETLSVSAYVLLLYDHVVLHVACHQTLLEDCDYRLYCSLMC